MNVENFFEYRSWFVYGLKNWPFYGLAFVFIPIILSNYALIISSSDKRYFLFALFSMLISFAASLSLGSKGGLFGFVLSLGICFCAFLGMTGRSVTNLFRSRNFMLFTLFSVAT